MAPRSRRSRAATSQPRRDGSVCASVSSVFPLEFRYGIGMPHSDAIDAGTYRVLTPPRSKHSVKRREQFGPTNVKSCEPEGPQELTWRSQAARGVSSRRSAGADDHELVGGGLGAPDLAGAAEQLADGRAAREAERRERLVVGVEADERVRAEVGEPDDVALVDVDGVGLRAGAGQPPLAPAARRRVVAADLAGVPLADPEAAARVGPDAPRALVRASAARARSPCPLAGRCGRGGCRRARRSRRPPRGVAVIP